MTQPKIWSKILPFHEISALANGCGFETSSDVEVRPTKQYFRIKQRFTNGECITGKGKHLLENSDIREILNFLFRNLGTWS